MIDARKLLLRLRICLNCLSPLARHCRHCLACSNDHRCTLIHGGKR